ncbi:MAG: hypothetical protein R3E53_04105 [Myxococcota bacterium]
MAETRPHGASRDAQYGFSKVFVHDLDAMAAFYEDVFGWCASTGTRTRCSGGKIDEISFQATARPAPARSRWIKRVDRTGPLAGESVQGFTTSDLDALVARAEAAGGSRSRSAGSSSSRSASPSCSILKVTSTKSSSWTRDPEDCRCFGELADNFRLVAPPRISRAPTARTSTPSDEGRGANGPPGSWILPEKSSAPVIATTSGELPEGVELTWDMLLTNPVFRGYLARQGVCLPGARRTATTARASSRWPGATGARVMRSPRPTSSTSRGRRRSAGRRISTGRSSADDDGEHAPLAAARDGQVLPFRRWRRRRNARLILQGPDRRRLQLLAGRARSGDPFQIQAPMWGRAVVVENEMMFHHGQACGPVAMRQHRGLDIKSTIEPDPDAEGGWRIVTGDVVNQRIPEQEVRFLVHWGARVFGADFDELKVTLDLQGTTSARSGPSRS